MSRLRFVLFIQEVAIELVIGHDRAMSIGQLHPYSHSIVAGGLELMS